MKILLSLSTAACLFVSGATQARITVTAAAALTVYVAATGGSDASDCLSAESPCASISGAYAKLRSDYDFVDVDPIIQLLDGIHTAADANGYLLNLGRPLVGTNAVVIQGHPGNRNAVVLRPGAATTGIWVQDGSIGIVRDLTCDAADHSGATCFQVRQMSILDINNVEFGSLPNGVGALALDQGGMNVSNVYFNGNALVGLFASTSSRAVLAGSVTISQAVSITYFLLSYNQSTFHILPGTSFVNPGNLTGQGCRVFYDATLLKNGITIPGSDCETGLGGNVY